MFQINEDEWRIIFALAEHPELMRSDGTMTLGTCNNLNKTIYIREGLNPYQLKKVLCHELTHAAMFSYHIELNYEQEELLADLIATYGQEIIFMTNSIFSRLRDK